MARSDSWKGRFRVRAGFVSRVCLTLLLLTSTAILGCAGDGPAVETATGFDAIQRTIFDVRCLSAGCHSSSDRAGNLVLEAGFAYADLVNVTSFNPAAQSAGLLRVMPNDAERSFLFIKVTNPTSAQGVRMPSAAPALSSSDVALIRDWIEAGAPGPGGPAATATSVPPTPTVTPEDTATPVPTATVLPSATHTPAGTATHTPTGTLLSTPTATLTPLPSATQTPTGTASATVTATPTAAPSPIITPTFSVASTFPEIQTNIFVPSCLGLSCHNATDNGGSLVLEGSVAYADLVGAAPENLAAQQDGLLRVAPGDPAGSFLLTKLTLPTVFDLRFGSRMPLAALPLTAEQIDVIRAWILRGALENETPQ